MNHNYLKARKEEVETYRRLLNLVAHTIHVSGYNFGSTVQPEDILHEVIEDLKGSHTYDFDFQTGIVHGAYDQKNFMITAVRNKCNATYKKEQRRKEVESLASKARNKISIRADDNSVMGEFSKAVILQLAPEEARRVLRLKHDGYKHHEISEQLGITTDASKKRYQRAKEGIIVELRGEKHFLGNFDCLAAVNIQKPAS